MERFNLKKLNDVGGKEQFRKEVSNRFAALELKKLKPWFDEGCSKLFD
jgi:hypothetical protein